MKKQSNETPEAAASPAQAEGCGQYCPNDSFPAPCSTCDRAWMNKKKEETEKTIKPRTLPQLALSINAALKRAANEYLKVGEMLTQAREFHASQKEFLAWSFETCSLRKSQTFNLMKCFKEFGQDERFDGVAMRVLNLLTGQTEAVKDTAAEKAQAGALGSKAVEKIIADSNPAPEKSTENSATAPEARSEGLETPADTSTAPGAIDALTAEISELRKQNDRHLEVIQELTEALAKQAAAPVKRSAPMLAQFKSLNMACRLGLSEDEAKVKKAVNARYRAFVKIYDEDSNPAAFKLLTEAKELLA